MMFKNFFSEEVLNNLSEVWDIIGRLWSLKVARIENNDVTIANIFIALFIFIIGYRISKKVSRIIRNIQSMRHLSENTIYMIETISFYFLLIIFTFTSLSIAQIPLKVFALLGGALAIGFGFGSQNIIKNFISGLILMAEQPIRVGDVISIDNGTEGKVIRIGARSTHILTFDNIDILVPNSSFLELNVKNYTLTDNYIRTKIKVGVDYGSDSKHVEKILRNILEKNPDVIKERQIKIFFVDFGSSSIDFEVQFWCEMHKPSDKKDVESDLRHSIYETFAKEGIGIAYPHMNVQLDVPKKVSVKLAKAKV